LANRLLRQDYGIALQPNSLLREQIKVVLLQKIREKAWLDKLSHFFLRRDRDGEKHGTDN